MVTMITQCLWLNSDTLRAMRLHSERDVFVFYSKTSEHFNLGRAAANPRRELGAGVPACVHPPASTCSSSSYGAGSLHRGGNAAWEMLLYSLLRMGRIAK